MIFAGIYVAIGLFYAGGRRVWCEWLYVQQREDWSRGDTLEKPMPRWMLTVWPIRTGLFWLPDKIRHEYRWWKEAKQEKSGKGR